MLLVALPRALQPWLRRLRRPVAEDTRTARLACATHWAATPGSSGRGEPGGRAGHRQRGDHGAAVAVDGGGHRHQPRLQFGVDDGVALRPDRREVGLQLGAAGDGPLGRALQAAGWQRCRAVGEQHLAQRGAVQRDRAPQPVADADHVHAVDLGDLLDHAVPLDAEVDRLAGLLAEALKERLGQLGQPGFGAAAPGEPDEHLARAEPAVVVALHQPVALQRQQQPGGGALGQPGRGRQLGEGDRARGVHDLGEEPGRPVHRLRAAGTGHYASRLCSPARILVAVCCPGASA